MRKKIEVYTKQGRLNVQEVTLVFGPHFAVTVRKKGEKLSFEMVATHHGFKVRDVNTMRDNQLEKVIDAVVRYNPSLKTDSPEFVEVSD